MGDSSQVYVDEVSVNTLLLEDLAERNGASFTDLCFKIAAMLESDVYFIGYKYLAR